MGIHHRGSGPSSRRLKRPTRAEPLLGPLTFGAARARLRTVGEVVEGCPPSSIRQRHQSLFTRIWALRALQGPSVAAGQVPVQSKIPYHGTALARADPPTN